MYHVILTVQKNLSLWGDDMPKVILYIYLMLGISTVIVPNQAERPKIARAVFFFHGAISIKPHLTIPNIIRLICDDIDNSVYKESVEIMRDDPFFFQNQLMQERGLRKIDFRDTRPGATSSIFASLYHIALEESGHATAQDHYYYTFGWSGLLSPRCRYQESKEAYIAIQQELHRLKEQHKYNVIEVEFVGYSHGGTICLLVAQVHDQEYPTEPFSVDYLTLLGTPVQAETDYLVLSPVFKQKKIWHQFSEADRIQRLDFFSLKRFFSRRTFPKRCHSDHLTQIKIVVTNKVQVPARNKIPKFKKHLVTKYVDYSPGHSELWFPGWTPFNFRKEFPLYPAPMLLFTPFITKALEQHCPHARRVVIDIRAYKNTMIIKADNKYIEIPFVDPALVQLFQTEINNANPKNFTAQEYDRRVDSAIELKKQEFCSQPKNKKKAYCIRREAQTTTECLV